MEQINGMAAMLQTVLGQQGASVPTVGSSDFTGENDFQKLLDKKTQDVQTDSEPSKKPETKAKDKTSEDSKSKTESKDKTKETGSAGQETAPVQIVEDPKETYRKLVESGELAVVGTALDFQAPVFVAEPVEESVLTTQPLENTLQGPIQGTEIDPLTWTQTAPVSEEPAETLFDAMPQVENPVAENTVQTTEAEEIPVVQAAAQAETPQLETNVEQSAGTAPVTEVQNAVQDTDQEEAVTDAGVSNEAQPLFHDVKAAPIKVAEAPAAEQSEEVDVGEQIADPLVNALKQGDSRVTVRLDPEYLGTVEVQITQSADGAMHVALTAASSETRSLLEKHAANLQLLLTNRGQEHVQVEVQRREESQQGQNQSYEGHGENQSRRQQEQNRQNHPQNSEDFLQQLRLGLIPLEVEAT